MLDDDTFGGGESDDDDDEDDDDDDDDDDELDDDEEDGDDEAAAASDDDDDDDADEEDAEEEPRRRRPPSGRAAPPTARRRRARVARARAAAPAAARVAAPSCCGHSAAAARLLNRLSEPTIDGERDLAGFTEGRRSCSAARSPRRRSRRACPRRVRSSLLLHASLLRALAIRWHARRLAVRRGVRRGVRGAFRRGGEPARRQRRLLSRSCTRRAPSMHVGYDLVRRLVDGFGELELDVLKLLLRVAGARMRADDPSALRR